MKHCIRLTSLLALALILTAAAEPAPISVVASFSILGDIVQQIGGERVAVTSLVGPGGNAHVYQPTPRDAEAVAKARLIVLNGLHFEGWLNRLLPASGFKGMLLVASSGVVPRIAPSGMIDPHAWQDLRNGAIYARNIAKALLTVDPAGAPYYQQRAQTYIANMLSLDQQVRAQLSTLPPERRRLLTSHDAFGYFAAAYGLEILAPTGVSTEAEASAYEVGALIRQVRAEHIHAVFLENITDPRLIEQIASESGAKVGGTLYTDALSEQRGPAPNYLAMFSYNARTLLQALAETK